MDDVKTIRVRAVLAYDDDGHFMIHGSDEETPQDMAKAIQPIWQHDPSKENMDYIEFDVLVPVVATRTSAQIILISDEPAVDGNPE